ncbi:MAG TPA: pre-peptidase C-terminal domain-containing protein [Planctomycetaceae bacterium]|nr:pre-peptidase C-terminal domain-containing protein [Planctomycetaceae bacterium]
MPKAASMAPGAKPQAWLVALFVLMIVGDALAAPPTLSQVFPPGGQRGSTVAVTLTGKFDWPVNVWSPGVDIAAGTDSGKLDITIPADLATDRIWLRLHSAEGASNLVPFLIGSLKELTEDEPNNSPRKAQTLESVAVTINGKLEKADVDGFLVPLIAGQTLVAAVDANVRLGSPMDAILQVASPDGTVLAENHDAVGLDPRLVFTATKTGPHIVRLFAFPSTPDSTIAFRGGSDYVYRLTLTTGPFVSHAVPLTVSATDPGQVAVHGWNLLADAKLAVMPFGGPRLVDHAELEPLGELRTPSEARLGFVFSPEFAGSARVRIVPHEVIASVPQSDAEHPFALTLPMAVTGCLTVPRQRDVYQFALTKGQAVLITAEAESLDFPVDPVLQLLDPQGGEAAEVDDTGKNRDAVLAHTAKSDGNYRLTVTDRYRHGSPRGFYRLSVRTDQPDFELSASADVLVVTPGKPAELTVSVQPRNIGDQNVGPISITAESLPEGVTLAQTTTEAKSEGRRSRSSPKVTLTFTASGPAFSGPIRLIGKATEPQEIQRRVRTPEKLGATWDSIWLTVTAPAN